MDLQRIERDFTVCKIDSTGQIDFAKEFVFVSKTDEEISLVCESASMPRGVIASEPGWKALKVSGVLDFGMIGILSNIARILAEAGISLFVVSTYNTDYIFVKSTSFDRAIQELMQNGHTVR